MKKEEIKIPQMGESISEASIGALLKSSGSQVAEGDEIVELETEKVNQVLYAPCAGILTLSVKVGDTVKIGDVIGGVDREGSQEVKQESKPEPKLEQKNEPKPESVPIAAPSSGRRIMAQEFIKELKEPFSQKPLEPTKAESTKAIRPIREGETRKPLSKIRKTIARRLVDSLHTAAMLTSFNEVDMSAVIALREKHKESFLEKHGVKLGFMSFFVKAVVEALKSFPDFNSYLDGDEIVTRLYYDIGIAVGTEKGLVVPVVRGCELLSFADIEKAIAGFAKKARSGKLEIADLEGGSFTITNGGVYGSMLSTPILNPPQVGILGMHNIVKRAVVVNDEIAIRPIMYLALSYDHRLVDGKEAVTFLVHIKKILEDPSSLLFDE